ncbi:hypothetical protein UMM65_12110 [Aureibaculum sp. 2210JD6-5]|uniref:hypothetical protein n=1 Tax=Aureibaculum sp. 2210JD6-5 TaxID=3103957 RepID=UPI002AAD67FB|nr:hypothetical protein [Aureibaculum sp. 2210JD6-5]MDY7395993.1 hypothetical protein [Aureibaculum sp. 2210JD6-5]
MKYTTCLILFLLVTSTIHCQDNKTEKVWRVNFLNPAIELELPTGAHSTLSSAIGISFDGSYPHLTVSSGTGFIYMINPFIDLQEKWFYNLAKRIEKNKTIDNNSGNFISARFLMRGYSLAGNITRTSDFDFAIGPTWGFQRKYGKNFHLLFDMGPIYYFDGLGNGNIFPLMLQLNLGFDL